MIRAVLRHEIGSLLRLAQLLKVNWAGKGSFTYRRNSEEELYPDCYPMETILKSWGEGIFRALAHIVCLVVEGGVKSARGFQPRGLGAGRRRTATELKNRNQFMRTHRGTEPSPSRNMT